MCTPMGDCHYGIFTLVDLCKVDEGFRGSLGVYSYGK